ncbi:TPA: aminodeoxychorismate lyase [Vibrio vulnificus]
MYWVNGVVATEVSLSDRSFQYGDGCFTTMKTLNGQIEHWPLHIERMEACLQVLSIPLPDWALIEQWLHQAALPDARGGLKLHISRGEGGRGYSPSGVATPNVTISSFSYPVHYSQWQQHGVELGVCQTPLGINPILAGHKHNNRLEQVLCKGELDALGYQDGVTFNVQNHVIETTIANLFWVKNGVLFTPDLTLSGVSGVMRRLVMGEAQHRAIACQEIKADLSSLLAAEEVFMTNSLLGVAPINQILETRYPIGATTRYFQGIFNS